MTTLIDRGSKCNGRRIRYNRSESLAKPAFDFTYLTISSQAYHKASYQSRDPKALSLDVSIHCASVVKLVNQTGVLSKLLCAFVKFAIWSSDKVSKIHLCYNNKKAGTIKS